MTLRLDHVQIAMPAGGEAEARRFFGELLGLVEIDKPPELAGRGGCWFDLGDRQLHLGVDPDFRPTKKAHVALACDALAELQTCLELAGCTIKADHPVHGRDRFFTEDPFGNRIELISLNPVP